MDNLRCRLCAMNANQLIQIEECLATRILTLFHVQIGGPEDRLSCYICDSCNDTVNSAWQFLERVQRTQQELLDSLNLSELTYSTSSETKFIHCNALAAATEEELLEEEEEEDEQELPQESVEEKVKVITRNHAKLSKAEKNCAENVVKKSENDDVLSGTSDCEENDDGSVIMQKSLQGWENYPWVCNECGQSANNYEELREHFAKMHPQTSRFACADCPKLYTKYSMFLMHVRVHRPYLRFCCDICHKWFRTAKRQELHRATHSDERPHTCTTCGKRFRMQSALLVHSRSHLPLELKNRYQCDQCPKRFGTKPNLMAHKRIHAGVRDFTCDQCGKSFVQKGNLDNHLLTHTAARPYNCSACGKSFKTLVRLRKHSSVHSGLKPHQCDVCGRQFRERGTLKEHHRIHTGAMPFTCEFCGKNFRFKGVLTTHRRQHTGERPYSCLECQHHFTNWPNYNKHMKRRHGINTSVTVRKPQTIPPTGMPQRNPPGTVLAPPQLPEAQFTPENHTFYPVLNIYNISDELLQPRAVQ